MKSAGPKVLQPLCGRSMLEWVAEQAFALDPERIVVVIGKEGEGVRRVLAGLPGAARVRTVVQEPRLGTGHALQCCLAELAGAAGPVVVLCGDMPLVRAESLEQLCRTWREGCGGRGLALLSAEARDPRGYGRVVRSSDGAVQRIVEERDASPAERAIREVNLGVYAFEPALLARSLPKLGKANAQGEYYLTDVVRMAVEERAPVQALAVEDEREATGVNTLSQLAQARAALQERILERHMAGGVWIEDPETTFVDWGVEIGAGARLLPCTVIRSGVVIGAGCEVGPFAHLRAGTVLAAGAEVGNFTECKNARLGEHAKAKHLSYLGDVGVGARANIGAGTIVANYDGQRKHQTTIGDRAFIGSGSVLIAPVEVGEGALTGAGAVVTRNARIPAGEAWVGVPARPIVRRRPGAGQSEATAEAKAAPKSGPADGPKSGPKTGPKSGKGSA